MSRPVTTNRKQEATMKAPQRAHGERPGDFIVRLGEWLNEASRRRLGDESLKAIRSGIKELERSEEHEGEQEAEQEAHELALAGQQSPEAFVMMVVGRQIIESIKALGGSK
jgi:hypothetical protein